MQNLINDLIFGPFCLPEPHAVGLKCVFCCTLLAQFCNVLLHGLYLGYRIFASHWGSWQRYNAMSACMSNEKNLFLWKRSEIFPCQKWGKGAFIDQASVSRMNRFPQNLSSPPTCIIKLIMLSQRKKSLQHPSWHVQWERPLVSSYLGRTGLRDRWPQRTHWTSPLLQGMPDVRTHPLPASPNFPEVLQNSSEAWGPHWQKPSLAEMLGPGCPFPLLWPWQFLVWDHSNAYFQKGPPQHACSPAPNALPSRLHILKNKLVT